MCAGERPLVGRGGGQVESFWSIYNHIVRPNDVTGSTELHLFKHGIKPMWEVRGVGHASTDVGLVQ